MAEGHQCNWKPRRCFYPFAFPSLPLLSKGQGLSTPRTTGWGGAAMPLRLLESRVLRKMGKSIRQDSLEQEECKNPTQ